MAFPCGFFRLLWHDSCGHRVGMIEKFLRKKGPASSKREACGTFPGPVRELAGCWARALRLRTPNLFHTFKTLKTVYSHQSLSQYYYHLILAELARTTHLCYLCRGVLTCTTRRPTPHHSSIGRHMRSRYLRTLEWPACFEASSLQIINFLAAFTDFW